MADTSAPLSEVVVASMAASMLDEFRIVSLDADDPMARFFAREFGPVRDEVLQLYPWHPATKRAVLEPTSDAPAFGWSYAYNLPADCLRLHELREFGKLNGREIQYEVESGQILTNWPTPLYVQYTQRLTNMAKWRPLMARVLAARLARYAATRITGKQSYFQKVDQEYKSALIEATHADSLERGTPQNVYGEADVFTVRGVYDF